MKLSTYISTEEKQSIFSTYQYIDSVGKFDQWYQSHCKLPYYFRGIKEACYKNYTSAQRVCITHDLDCLPSTLVYLQVQKLRKEHGQLFEKYCKAIGIDCSDFFLMSYAQHYKNGISPLLDVTTDLDTALFFMCNGAQFSTNGVDTNSIENYASIYFINKEIPTFDDVLKNLVSKVEFPQNISKEDFIKCAEYYALRVFGTSLFNLFAALSKYSYFLVDNKQYLCAFNKDEFNYQKTLTIGNFNMTAQNGCFIYYDNDKEPFEEKVVECVDIHKKLIPYITQEILIPKNKTEEYLFPDIDKIVNDSYEKMLADNKIL